MNNVLEQLKSKLSDNAYNNFALALSNDYLSSYSLEDLISDCTAMESLNSDNEYAISINKGDESLDNRWQIKLIRYNDSVSLSRGLPIIENFGFKLIDEIPYKIKLKDGNIIYICNFGVEVPDGLVVKINDNKVVADLKEAIIAAFTREVDSDGLNKLVIYSSLSVREVAVIRAMVKYMVQTALPFSAAYIGETLRKYSYMSWLISQLFEAKFNPEKHNVNQMAHFSSLFEDELVKVQSIDEDQILKTAYSIINAMVRTNFYQKNADGSNKPYISFKLESAKVLNLPKPHPLYEIFVYSLRFEAVHLRGGKVARGGLRWSDRKEDFRTEVLGLVKAQMVKNSVIVPTGSKGGFVCKKLPDPSDREAYMAEGINCYKQFISGLLDITDNLVNGKVVHPANVVRHDEDDPYLVVAADKGTATFSDFANQVSLDYGFWLGDAFASGGSAGYDHKKMGITAKGAWEAVKRHFRHLGIDTQTQEFSVIGIGDLMGDVFGNGMLLSRHIKLIAAFNHMHIFLDPNPHVADSYEERLRMFNLPRSTWDDYDRSKISQGGGIYLRSSKTIPLTEEVKHWLGVSVDSMAPNELINLILKAKADLLYNGGIGTYFKAETQSNEEVKDKANDALRVNGKDLQVRVIGEGGNLGATQLGRIEFARNGGNVCTDAIDNSAGVDCSDHEVNIKILFAHIMQKTGMSIEERNKILESMTDDVSDLVLRDNYLQTQLIRSASLREHYTLPNHLAFMRKLEKAGVLDRKIEFLPSDAEIKARSEEGRGLTSPELSVLLAYSKMTLDKEILDSNLVTDSDFDELLVSYFPKYIQQTYRAEVLMHYLRREIIANQLANLVVNRAGITFISRFKDEFNVDTSRIVKAWWIAYNLLDAATFNQQIEMLDNKINANVQVSLLVGVEKAVERLCRLVLLHIADLDNATGLINHLKPQITELVSNIANLIDGANYPEIAEEESKLLAENVPSHLAQIVSRQSYLVQVVDIVTIANKHNLDANMVARNYFYVGRNLQVDWLRKNVFLLPRENKWQALARSALVSDIYKIYKHIMISAIEHHGCNVEVLLEKNADKLEQIHALLEELQSYPKLDLAMLSAAIREYIRIIS
jgi:glutamate dehydrogenase